MSSIIQNFFGIKFFVRYIKERKGCLCVKNVWHKGRCGLLDSSILKSCVLRYIIYIKGGAEWLLDARLSNLCPLDSLSSRRLLPQPPLIIPPLLLNTKIVRVRAFNTIQNRQSGKSKIRKMYFANKICLDCPRFCSIRKSCVFHQFSKKLHYFYFKT